MRAWQPTPVLLPGESPWTEEAGRLQSKGSQRVGLDWVTKHSKKKKKKKTIKLFKILKDAAAKVLHSICQQIWKTQQWSKDWRRSIFIWISKRGNAKDSQTTTGLHSFHILAKCCSKFSKPDFNSTWTEDFQMFKLDLEKPEKLEIKLPASVRS